MSDIIERLRSYKGPWLVPAEAAVEIEKLRAERDAAMKEIEVLKSEIKFWRRQYDDAKKWYQSVTGKGAWE